MGGLIRGQPRTGTNLRATDDWEPIGGMPPIEQSFTGSICRNQDPLELQDSPKPCYSALVWVRVLEAKETATYYTTDFGPPLYVG